HPVLLYTTRDLRYPPSFPTRRSSDLVLDRLKAPCALAQALQGGVHRGFVDGDAGPPERNRRQIAGVERRHRVERRGEGQRLPFLDRKSTRLNSSHLGISYAVFCLKKK